MLSLFYFLIVWTYFRDLESTMVRQLENASDVQIFIGEWKIKLFNDPYQLVFPLKKEKLFSTKKKCVFVVENTVSANLDRSVFIFLRIMNYLNSLSCVYM